jgi:hypothetical protein
MAEAPSCMNLKITPVPESISTVSTIRAIVIAWCSYIVPARRRLLLLCSY